MLVILDFITRKLSMRRLPPGPVYQWRLVVKMAWRAAKFHLWLNIKDCRPAPGCL